MITVRDIHVWVSDRTGHPLQHDEGTMYGDQNRPITGVSVCWEASPGVIGQTVEAGHELLIFHESLLYPYPFSDSYPANAGTWKVNRQRLAALTAADIVATRLHGSLDQLYILHAFAEQLGLGQPVFEGPSQYCRVYRLDPPRPYRTILQQVKAAMGMSHVRATMLDPDRNVRFIGLPWGGMGLFVNMAYVQSLLDVCPDIDLMIAGETDNYVFRYSVEQGVDMLETSHELSEDRGLLQFAREISTHFSDLNVTHIPTSCIWSVV